MVIHVNSGLLLHYYVHVGGEGAMPTWANEYGAQLLMTCIGDVVGG